MFYLPLDSEWYDDNMYISNASIGDNVVPFLQRLSVEKDFPISLDIYLSFEDELPLKAKDMETGKVFNNTDEFLNFYWGKYVYDQF